MEEIRDIEIGEILPVPQGDLALLDMIFKEYPLAIFRRMPMKLKAKLKALGHIQQLVRLEREAGQGLAMADARYANSLSDTRRARAITELSMQVLSLLSYEEFCRLPMETRQKAAENEAVPSQLVQELIQREDSSKNQREPAPPTTFLGNIKYKIFRTVLWYLESWLVLLVTTCLNWLGLFLSQFSSYWDDKTMGMWKAAFKGKVPPWIYIGCIFTMLPGLMAEVSKRIRAKEIDSRLDSICRNVARLEQQQQGQMLLFLYFVSFFQAHQQQHQVQQQGPQPQQEPQQHQQQAGYAMAPALGGGGPRGPHGPAPPRPGRAPKPSASVSAGLQLADAMQPAPKPAGAYPGQMYPGGRGKYFPGGRNWAGARPPPPGQPGFSSGLQVVVHNLPWDCTWQQLRDAFQECGEPKRADVVFDSRGRSRGFGIVRFSNRESAEMAAEKMNNTTIGGRLVSVRLDRFA